MVGLGEKVLHTKMLVMVRRPQTDHVSKVLEVQNPTTRLPCHLQVVSLLELLREKLVERVERHALHGDECRFHYVGAWWEKPLMCSHRMGELVDAPREQTAAGMNIGHGVYPKH